MILDNAFSSVCDDKDIGYAGIAGLSTIVSISFGMDFVAGSTLVPRPAAGITAFVTFIVEYASVYLLFYTNRDATLSIA